MRTLRRKRFQLYCGHAAALPLSGSKRLIACLAAIILVMQTNFHADNHALAVSAVMKARRTPSITHPALKGVEYHFYDPPGHAAPCDSAPVGARQHHVEALAPPTMRNSDDWRRAARRIPKTGQHWFARRSLASTRCAFAKRPFDPSTTKRSPMSLPHGSMRCVVLKPILMPICETFVAAMSDGGADGQGAATR